MWNILMYLKLISACLHIILLKEKLKRLGGCMQRKLARHCLKQNFGIYSTINFTWNFPPFLPVFAGLPLRHRHRQWQWHIYPHLLPQSPHTCSCIAKMTPLFRTSCTAWKAIHHCWPSITMFDEKRLWSERIFGRILSVPLRFLFPTARHLPCIVHITTMHYIWIGWIKNRIDRCCFSWK